MRRATEWLATSGRRRALAVVLDWLRALAVQATRLRRIATAVIRRGRRAAWDGWRAAAEAEGAGCALQANHRRLSSKFRRRVLLTLGMSVWFDRMAELTTASARRARAERHAVKVMRSQLAPEAHLVGVEHKQHNTSKHTSQVISSHLRRSWWVWCTTLRMHRSLRVLTFCALARVAAQHAWGCWTSTVASQAGINALSSAADAFRVARDVRLFLLSFRQWRAACRARFEHRQRPGLHVWSLPATARALDTWRRLMMWEWWLQRTIGAVVQRRGLPLSES